MSLLQSRTFGPLVWIRRCAMSWPQLQNYISANMMIILICEYVNRWHVSGPFVFSSSFYLFFLLLLLAWMNFPPFGQIAYSWLRFDSAPLTLMTNKNLFHLYSYTIIISWIDFWTHMPASQSAIYTHRTWTKWGSSAWIFHYHSIIIEE